MARKRKPKLFDIDRENMIARVKMLMSEINELKSGLRPGSGDFQALDAFYMSTRKLVIDLSGEPKYFDHAGSGLDGLGSSRERR